MAVGTERRRVEGDQRGAGTLGAGHPLDARVQPGQRSLPPGDQAADRLIGIAAGGVVAIPGFGDGGVPGGGGIAKPKDQVAALEQFLPVLLQGRMDGCSGRVPLLKKAHDGTGGKAVHPVQQRQVQRLGCRKTVGGARRFALVIRPQQIPAVVAQKVGEHAGAPLDRGGHKDVLGRQHGLFAADCLLLQMQQPDQPAIPVQGQAVTDLGLVPSRPVDLPQHQQVLIILGQRLQDHRSTSQFWVSNTPCSSLARK